MRYYVSPSSLPLAASSRLTSSSFATGFSFSSSTSATSTASLLTKYTFHPRFGGHVVASLSASSSTTRLNAATAKELAESVLKNPKYILPQVALRAARLRSTGWNHPTTYSTHNRGWCVSYRFQCSGGIDQVLHECLSKSGDGRTRCFVVRVG